MTTTATKTNTKTFTRIFLRREYGPRSWDYLAGLLNILPRARKEQQKYTWNGPAPTKEEAEVLKAKYFTTSLEDLVGGAFSDIEELANEMQEWYDNMPENFQDGDKGSEVQEAQDALSNIQAIDIPEKAGTIRVMFVPAEEISSRQDRGSDAAARLQVAADELRSALQDLVDAAPKDEPYVDEEGWGDLADELESAGQEVDGVSFPGMY